ncbi:HAD family hydrolase [Salinibacter sp. 10B]|uniref:HAD family hydrolase n=1 Tax=Salinibacter sp. 10B TaxID=1923971 RepID=UPI000CF41B85|nr:HAD hydrolase-like protein [Salinibacter sp. 10B]PQJ34333.1 HAD family hydrolase [Salinibacter sp. 10B]
MPENVSVNALLFDMDGVLVDVSRSYRRAIEETVEHFTGRKIGENAIQRYKNYGGFEDDWKLTHAIITDTAMEVPLSRVIEEFQDRYRGDDWDGFINEEPALIDDTTLDTLNDGRILGIVTGRPEEEAEWTLNHQNWSSYFPLLVGKEKQGERQKPDPFPLEHSLTMLAAAGCDLSPEEVAYVGDSVDDMKAARDANMWAIGVVPPYVDAEEHEPLLKERGAHLVIEDPNELPGVLDSLDTRAVSQAATR